VGQRVLVTGGAGYVGGHAAIALREAGFIPVVFDNLSRGHGERLEALGLEVVVGDVSDRRALDRLLGLHSFAAVLHFAAYAYVAESVADPALYYRNNVVGTLTLLEAMQAAGVRQIVFSSSCATYGSPGALPIVETMPLAPISPYGYSKMVAERLLSDFERAHGVRHVIFRYFNAAGADANGRLGEDHDPETHLIPLALLAASGARASLQVYGDDYSTPDGSCIRDYVHVSDLADAHVLGLRYLLAGGNSDVFNLGTGKGVSVLEVIECAARVTGRKIPVEMSARRPGDPPALYANADKARKVLGWTPRWQTEQMVGHAWAWQQASFARRAAGAPKR
jgi:UDP-glucose 4-epimerase